MLYLAHLALLALACAGFINRKLEQDVDITAAYARATVNVWAENTGTDDIAVYEVPFPAEEWPRVALFEAQSLSGMALSVEALPEKHAYAIELLVPTPPGEQVQFAYAVAYKNAIEALPEFAAQKDPQRLVFSGNKLIFSEYETDTQTTIIKTVTTKVKDLASGQEVSVDNKVGGVQFGPIANVPARTSKPLALQYDSPIPQAHVRECNRTIWISHWSDAVSFDERYVVENVGTKLSKPFSRLDYMTGSQQGGNSLTMSAIRQLRIPTGPTARDHYYVDLVGNVSTSAVHDGFMDVLMRFPLFGGWKTEFTIGWAGLLSSYVQSLPSNHYAMQVPLVRGPEGVAFDTVSNTIVLPEGATNVQVISEEAEETRYDTVYSYLDLHGRPAVTLVFNNLVSEHQQHSFTVVYVYNSTAALKKPFTYAALVFGVFALAKLSRTVDFSIKRSKKDIK